MKKMLVAVVALVLSSPALAATLDCPLPCPLGGDAPAATTKPEKKVVPKKAQKKPAKKVEPAAAKPAAK